MIDQDKIDEIRARAEAAKKVSNSLTAEGHCAINALQVALDPCTVTDLLDELERLRKLEARQSSYKPKGYHVVEKGGKQPPNPPDPPRAQKHPPSPPPA